MLQIHAIVFDLVLGQIARSLRRPRVHLQLRRGDCRHRKHHPGSPRVCSVRCSPLINVLQLQLCVRADTRSFRSYAVVFDREKSRLGFASSAGLCSINGTLECGASCNVIGPDYSVASIFTPLVIGIAAACGVVLLAAGYFCVRSCCSRRCPPPLINFNCIDAYLPRLTILLCRAQALRSAAGSRDQGAFARQRCCVTARAFVTAVSLIVARWS